MFKLSLFLILIPIIAISGCTIIDNNESSIALKEQCNNLDKEWKLFPNGCTDICEYERGEVEICTEALTYGCDCGPYECWNGKKCEPN